MRWMGTRPGISLQAIGQRPRRPGPDTHAARSRGSGRRTPRPGARSPAAGSSMNKRGDGGHRTGTWGRRWGMQQIIAALGSCLQQATPAPPPAPRHDCVTPLLEATAPQAPLPRSGGPLASGLRRPRPPLLVPVPLPAHSPSLPPSDKSYFPPRAKCKPHGARPPRP